jgi:hypothetical protein
MTETDLAGMAAENLTEAFIAFGDNPRERLSAFETCERWRVDKKQRESQNRRH